MIGRMRTTSIGTILFTLCLAGSGARAQDHGAPDETSPAPADTPAPEEGTPAPAEPAPAQPAPAADPAPPPQPQPQPYAQPAPQPQPYAQPAAQPAAPPPGAHYEGEANYQYGNEYGADANSDNAGEGDDGGGFEMPPFSIRLDPLNWLIQGRFSVELEVGLWKFLSFELVPVFVTESEPLMLNLSGRDDTVTQHSNGLGPISGTSLGLGFWLGGEPFRGYVLRAIFTNYGYTYKAQDSMGTFDSVDHTQRQLIAFFGSYGRVGFFTYGGGFGLGYELNQQERCDPTFVPNVDGAERIVALGKGCEELQIATDRFATGIAVLGNDLSPLVLMGRISLGVAFD